MFHHPDWSPEFTEWVNKAMAEFQARPFPITEALCAKMNAERVAVEVPRQNGIEWLAFPVTQGDRALWKSRESGGYALLLCLPPEGQLDTETLGLLARCSDLMGLIRWAVRQDPDSWS